MFAEFFFFFVCVCVGCLACWWTWLLKIWADQFGWLSLGLVLVVDCSRDMLLALFPCLWVNVS